MKLNKTKEAFDSFLETKVVPLDKRIVIAIFVVIIVAPVVAFYFLYFTDKTKEIKGLENRAVKLHKEIAEAKVAAAKLDEHLAEMEEVKRLFAEASVLLPQKKEIPSLLTNISALGTNSGLNMARFSPGGERKKEFYAEIPVSLSIQGPYHNIGTALVLLKCKEARWFLPQMSVLLLTGFLNKVKFRLQKPKRAKKRDKEAQCI